jgi:hypothetical protein
MNRSICDTQKRVGTDIFSLQPALVGRHVS